jgi:small-conductance mechanosensitive channel
MSHAHFAAEGAPETKPGRQGIAATLNSQLHVARSIGKEVGKLSGALVRQLLELNSDEDGAMTPAAISATANAHDAKAIPRVASLSGAGSSSMLDAVAAESQGEPFQLMRISHVAAALGISGFDLERAFSLFETEGKDAIDATAFIAASEKAFHDLRALRASLDGSNSAVAAVANLSWVVFSFALLVALLVVFDISVGAVLVPLGTFIVSASFAIGPTISSIVGSMLFVLVQRPFDAGDRVTVTTVADGELLLVQRIELLTTSFTRPNNRTLIVPNHVLLSLQIENLKRSATAVARLELHVPADAHDGQIEAMRRCLDTYLKEHSRDWKSNPLVRVVGFRDQAMTVLIFATSKIMWADTARLFRAITQLYLSVGSILRSQHLLFRGVSMSVKLEGMPLPHIEPLHIHRSPSV